MAPSNLQHQKQKGRGMLEKDETNVAIPQPLAQRVLEALEDFGMRHYESTNEVLHQDVYADMRELLALPEELKRPDVAIDIAGTSLEPESPRA